MNRVYITGLIMFFSSAALLYAQQTINWSVESTLIKANKKILPDNFITSYGTKDGQTFLIEWQKSVLDWLPQNAKVVSSNGWKNIEITPPVRYRGKVLKSPHASIATMMIYSDYTEVMISSEETGNVFISKRKSKPVEYAREAPFLEKNLQQTTCSPDLQHVDNQESVLRSSSSCKKIYVSVTADYDLYLKKNRQTSEVVNYIIGVFNNVMSIYQLEGIQVGISEIIVHQNPDAFRHLSALDDLNIFRFIRKTYDGHIALCLSGHEDATGQANLGGHAFVNALCNKAYSYAYVNVEGGFTQYPDYSWDIFGVTHELGHVIGSPHTHSCSWGPSKNSALDNCEVPEGQCTSGPPAREGTIMSYCHLPGGPGINFSAGFGDEPGDLIRSKVASATCLFEYVPDGTQPRINQTITANRFCSDGQYTHYYYDNNTVTEDDDILVLSIDSDGQNIGNILDGSLTVQSRYGQNVSKNIGTKITAPYVGSSDYYVMNKYWMVTSSRTPSKNVTIRLPFSDRDMNDLDECLAYTLPMEEVKAFVMTSPATANPDLNHRNATTTRYSERQMAYSAGTTTWKHVNSQGLHYAEFKTKTLHQYGMGAYFHAFLPVELEQFNAQRDNTDVILQWQAQKEINLGFYSLERSYNGTDFIEIDRIYPHPSRQYQYVDNDFLEDAYYRLKMVDNDLSITYSATNFVEGAHTSSQPIVHNNPVFNQTLHLNLPPSEDTYICEVYSSLGQNVMHLEIEANGHKMIDLSGFSNGFYVLKVTTAKLVHQETLVVADP